jgi:hypothetical protein
LVAIFPLKKDNVRLQAGNPQVCASLSLYGASKFLMELELTKNNLPSRRKKVKEATAGSVWQQLHVAASAAGALARLSCKMQVARMRPARRWLKKATT